MPVDLLDRTLELPVKSKIITQPYVDFLTHQYQLSHNGSHGIEHWFRVLMNGRLIAAQTGADLQVIEHFALLHDVKRYDESNDIDHGGRAAEFAKTLMGDWIHLDKEQLLKRAYRNAYYAHMSISLEATQNQSIENDA